MASLPHISIPRASQCGVVDRACTARGVGTATAPRGRTTFSTNPMAYYCIRAENCRRACQLEYDVDCAPENDSGMAAARIVIVR